MKVEAKAKAKSRKKYLMILFLMMCFSLAFLSYAYASEGIYKGDTNHCKKNYSPVAICITSGTNIPLPAYTCCQLNSKDSAFNQTWVPGSCQNAHPMAHLDSGCSIHSPVFGTGAPILGDCQFSYSTIS